jgi:hypothetical protein
MKTIEVINKTDLQVSFEQGKYVTIIQPSANKFLNHAYRVTRIEPKEDICNIKFENSASFMVDIHGSSKSEKVTRNLFLFDYGDARKYTLNKYDNVYESVCIVPRK